MRRMVELWVLASFVTFSGCGESGSALMAPAAPSDPSARLEVEESDIYRLDGDLLYVQNPQTGLNIVSLANAAAPQLLGRARVVGLAGELYLHRHHALVLLKSASAECQPLPGVTSQAWEAGSELAIVKVRDPEIPTLRHRFCLPGSLVTSRIVGEYLFLVLNRDTGSGELGARVLSVDLSEPRNAAVVAEIELPDASKEIHVTDRALFAAGWANGCGRGCGSSATAVQLVEISGTTGAMQRRGRLVVGGEPQGRFHLDADGDLFRIVTYDADARASRLSVLDFADPDRPKLLGVLPGIGYGERLYATRFDGDKAYVVTYRATDPLWVVSLANPARPLLLGELRVPGWSDFIFPRGDRLLAVGRGNRGLGLQVSLFDVSDPARPRSLQQVTFGGWDTSSEANLDHRAVTVLEPAGAKPMVVVPYSFPSSGPSCEATSFVQVVDVEPWGLRVRGSTQQKGAVRRSFCADETLVSISDYQVLALDLADRDRLEVRGSAQLGNAQSLECPPPPTQSVLADSIGFRSRRVLCQFSPEASFPVEIALALGLLAFVRFRSRRRLVQSGPEHEAERSSESGESPRR